MGEQERLSLKKNNSGAEHDKENYCRPAALRLAVCCMGG
jgi:hypothetical protein